MTGDKEDKGILEGIFIDRFVKFVKIDNSDYNTIRAIEASPEKQTKK